MGKISKTIVSLSPLSFIWLFISDTDYDKGMKAMNNGQHSKAKELFEEAIAKETNDNHAQAGEISRDINVIGSYFELGKIYLYGMGGVKPCESKAIDYLKKAASSERHTKIKAQANFLLGLYYHALYENLMSKEAFANKDDVNKAETNRAYAIAHFDTAAKNGNDDALYYLIMKNIDADDQKIKEYFNAIKKSHISKDFYDQAKDKASPLTTRSRE